MTTKQDKTPQEKKHHNQLILGDNLEVLKKIEDESVDLIYIDPPFFSNRNYEIIWGDTGEIRSFEDRWAGGMDHYIGWLKERVEVMYKKLKKTGSFYLHCDWHANSHIRVKILDVIFGENNFRNEIIVHWTAVGLKAKAKKFHQNTETIWSYVKNHKSKYTWNDVYISAEPRKASIHIWNSKTGKAERKRNEDGKIEYFTVDTKKQDSLIEVPALRGSEKIGYPTQKPEALLERIILASSNEGDTIMDCFCGGGTTVAVADRLNRKWIGIDQSVKAISVTEGRLQTQQLLSSNPFEKKLHKYDYDTLRNKEAFAFEKWIIEQFGGEYNEKQRNDFGIDGSKNNIPIQVKRSDNIGRNVIDNFQSAMDRFYTKNSVKNDDNKSNKEKIDGYIIAFSFGKGAVEEVARLRITKNIAIKLIEVQDIVEIAHKSNFKITFNCIGIKERKKEVEFSIILQNKTHIELCQWDFNYDKKEGFKPSNLFNKNDNIIQLLESGEHDVACKIIDKDGIQTIETIKIKVNGGVSELF